MASSLASERAEPGVPPPALPPLQPGDHLDQRTFHAVYEAMPAGFRAELIGGVVMVPLPVSAEHGGEHNLVAGWLLAYHARTPGTRSFCDTTVILGPDSEPQPDAALIILPECGGRTQLSGGYVTGPPELVVEVAYSTRAHDLHRKLQDYEAAGVGEYVVAILHEKRVEWFTRSEERFEATRPDADGLFRSVNFPGLWLDPAALIEGDASRVLAALECGLAAPEHAAFVGKLSAGRGGSPGAS